VFDKITGISRGENDNTVKVDYDLKETNITPFGDFLGLVNKFLVQLFF